MKAFIIPTVCIAALCGCTTKYSKPYSAEKTAKVLSKCFKTEIEPVSVNGTISKQPPCASTLYELRKKPEGFTFTAVAMVDYQGGTFCSNYVETNYTTALMLHYKQQAMTLAEKYHLKFVSVDSVDENPITKVYVYDPEQLKAVADLYFDLQKLYDFKVSKTIFLRIMWKILPPEPEFSIYCYPENDATMERAQLVYSCVYWDKYTKDATLRERYNNPDAFLLDLYGRWNEAYRQGHTPFPTPDRDVNKLRARQN